MKKLLIIFALSIIFAGCDAILGTEIARLPINQVSTEENLIIKETTINLKAGDELAIWSDMDMEYDGEVSLIFRVEILKNGKKTGEFEVDPMEKNLTVGEVKTSLMDKTNWSFTGKNSDITIDEDAEYTFKAILIASENSSLVINKAELFFKK